MTQQIDLFVSENIPDQPTLPDIYEQIRQVYLNYPHPWVIGYSGGKDSTAALQLVWYALADLPPEQRQKPVQVISSNTLVETPVIVDHIQKTLKKLSRRRLKRIFLSKHKCYPLRSMIAFGSI